MRSNRSPRYSAMLSLNPRVGHSARFGANLVSRRGAGKLPTRPDQFACRNLASTSRLTTFIPELTSTEDAGSCGPGSIFTPFHARRIAAAGETVERTSQGRTRHHAEAPGQGRGGRRRDPVFGLRRCLLRHRRPAVRGRRYDAAVRNISRRSQSISPAALLPGSTHWAIARCDGGECGNAGEMRVRG